MAFIPENPEKPSQLYVTFTNENNAESVVYNNQVDGPYSRVEGDWEPSDSTNTYINPRTNILFVSPNFIEIYDSSMKTGSPVPYSEVEAKYSVTPEFAL
jgi:hypothetical protein